MQNLHFICASKFSSYSIEKNFSSFSIEMWSLWARHGSIVYPHTPLPTYWHYLLCLVLGNWEGVFKTMKGVVSAAFISCTLPSLNSPTWISLDFASKITVAAPNSPTRAEEDYFWARQETLENPFPLMMLCTLWWCGCIEREAWIRLYFTLSRTV